MNIPAIAEEAREWPLDKLTRYILEHYHEGTVNRVNELWTLAEQCQGREGAAEMHVISQLLGESYEDLSNHFRKEEMMLFPTSSNFRRPSVRDWNRSRFIAAACSSPAVR